jgi:GNAT superfamily N-acetyltransferase
METSSSPKKSGFADSDRLKSGRKRARTFEQLYKRESWQLRDPVRQIEVRLGVEPWISFTPRDRFGLALSGGGIRSATFNLGLLQALAHLGVLKHVDYLSTVSGGGYIGGFWMAWLKRKRDAAKEMRKKAAAAHQEAVRKAERAGEQPPDRPRTLTKETTECFPLAKEQSGEPPEVRHLREFSRFLLPRVGVLETEFWAIIMTVLGGLIPSFLTAIAVLLLAWTTWLTITGILLTAPPEDAIALGAALALYLIISQWLWINKRKSEPNWLAIVGYVVGCLFGSAVMVWMAWFWPEIGPWLHKQFHIGDISKECFPFFPGLLLGAGTLILLFLRVALARFLRGPICVILLEGFERTLTRFLGATVCLLLLAALWWISEQMIGAAKWATAITATGAIGSAALFAWAKKWLMSPVEKTHASSLSHTAINHLKRATPKVLAWLAFLLLFLLVGTAIQALGVKNLPGDLLTIRFAQLLGVSGAIVFLAVLLFDPARVGMHEFYRTKISRCYLGASNPDRSEQCEFQKSPLPIRVRSDRNIGTPGREDDRAKSNRQIIERKDDDLQLKDLRKVSRPIHLICTAANDISGDALATLYRGARSAVLSKNGISIGDETRSLNHLRVSAALTASAAAFNSQMGRISMDLGPAVTFLMSALNLRLGLWVPHPKNRFRGYDLFPGRFFLFELLGRSRADAENVLLSDGNHFENFGLYELIRRHVRYIIVSDCGADPEVAFDDLANVLRRVREDFGVEIELDISALRHGDDGLAKQHAVVGTIHYNGITGMDKGTIIFFKPTMTGDEPPDVLQYRTRNRAFPHESTGDQFYDEPQWESYRRLGEHAARSALGFFDQPSAYDVNEVDKLFRDARAHWPPSPPRHQETFLEMTQRFVTLQIDLLANGPPQLRAEIFNEITELSGKKSKLPNVDEEMAIFSFLLRVTQLMEDVWVSHDLDQYWSHPLNEGWMAYFNRWASTGSFRRWWPVLAPIYSLRFREFAKQRFGVGVKDSNARGESERTITAGELTLTAFKDSDLKQFKDSHTWKSFLQTYPKFSVPQGATVFGYTLDLLRYDGELSGKDLLVGVVIVREEQPSNASRTAWWQSTELFVPRSMHGGGILARLLDALVKQYEKRKFGRLEVHFAPQAADQKEPSKPKVLSQAERQQRVQDIEFYKSRGFEYVGSEDATGKIVLALSLGSTNKT